MKQLKLEWNVFRHDFNSDKIVTYNVLDDEELLKEIKTKVKKKEINNFEELKDYLQHKFMYKYWSKTECEVLISGLFENDEKYKIDMWRQLEINLDRITEYIINEMKLFTKKEEYKYDARKKLRGID